MGRPKIVLDNAQVEQLAAINCSLEEMSAVLDCDISTLTRRFAHVIKKGRERGRMSLKRKQYEVAMGGNVTMLIWLGKQLLDQSDKINQTSMHTIEQIREVNDLPKEEKLKRLKSAIALLEGSSE